MLRKYYFILILLSLGSLRVSTLQAQFSVGMDLGLGVPVGDLSRFWEAGAGLRFKGRYFFNDNLGLGLTVGYYSFNDEGDNFGEGNNLQVVPFTVDVVYKFTSSNVKPYLSGGVGTYFTSFKNRRNQVTFDTRDELGVHVGGGVLFEVAPSFDLGGDLRMNLADNLSHVSIGLSLMYTFSR